MQQFNRKHPSQAVIAAALLALSVGACNQNGSQTNAQAGAPPPALPLTTGAETPPTLAPSAAALPAAPRPKIVRVASQADQYAYVDQAQAMGAALGSAPPDYAFDYDGGRPWVWRASDNSTRFVEPVEGGYRYYYYRPGADYPYFVQDPQYGYGFDNGQLVVIYDARGNPLPPQYVDQRADYAGRYLARARALYNASQQAERRSVIAANWAARRAQIDAQQAEWSRQQAEDAAWRSYHDAHADEMRNYWQAEAIRRDQAAQQFNQWHDGGYQGPPPPPPSYAPVAGAALVGAAAGAYLAGRGHDHGPPASAPPPGGFYPGGPNPAVDQGRREQAAQDAQRQAQAQQEAQSATAARQQALSQGRQQQAAADAARQAQAEQQARQLSDARRQQQAADQRQERQTQAQEAQAQRAQVQQAQAQRQAQGAARTQAREQQAAQAAAQRQAAASAQRQAHEQQAAQAASQAAGQRQAQEAARAQAAQARQQEAAQAAAQHQAQAQAAQSAQHQAQAQAAAAHAQAAQAAAHAAHPPGGPHPGGEHGPHPGGPDRPQR